MPFFKVENLTKRFGGLTAVDDVSFEVEQGEVYTIIGPNGAGKTTIFNLVSLIYPATSGRIVFQDQDLAGLAPDKVAAHPTSHTGRYLAEVLRAHRATA